MNKSRNIITSYFQLFIIISIGYISTLIFNDLPIFSILFIDILFSLFLIYHFSENKGSFLFLLHPIILLILSVSIDNIWFANGDGLAHQVEANRVMEIGFLNRINEISLEFNTTNPLFLSKYLSLGALPSFTLPSILYFNPPQQVYIISQSLILYILLSFYLPIIIQWNIFNTRILFYYYLFLSIAPSLLVFTYAPHRHFVTQFSLFVLFSSHYAIKLKFSFSTLLFFFIGIILMILSKPAYILLYFAFVILERLLIVENNTVSLRARKISLLFFVTFLIFISLNNQIFDYFNEGQESISERSQIATNTLVGSSFQNLPIINIFFKYILALLSPFPYSKFNYFIQEIFGGSWLHFILHVLSSITGFYLFLCILLNLKKIRYLPNSVKSSLLFGLLISAGIMGGVQSYHNYITPSFVFLTPILFYPDFNIRAIYPISLIIFIELFVDLIQNI